MAGKTNQKIEPFSGPGSMPISPPMASTRRLEMASPSPEPPNLRAWLESAWTNSWKISWRLCEGTPTPVSRTSTRRKSRSAALEHPHQNADSAFFGEFDGIAHQIGEHLTEADLIDANGLGDVARHHRGNLDVLGMGARTQELGDPRHQRADFDFILVQCQRAGFDLGEIQNIADQAAAVPRPIA